MERACVFLLTHTHTHTHTHTSAVLLFQPNLTFKWSSFPVYTSGLRGLYEPNNLLSNCTKNVQF